MRPFPRRTLLLMILALAAFARLWCVTHPKRAAEPIVVTPIAPDGGR